MLAVIDYDPVISNRRFERGTILNAQIEWLEKNDVDEIMLKGNCTVKDPFFECIPSLTKLMEKYSPSDFFYVKSGIITDLNPHKLKTSYPLTMALIPYISSDDLVLTNEKGEVTTVISRYAAWLDGGVYYLKSRSLKCITDSEIRFCDTIDTDRPTQVFVVKLQDMINLVDNMDRGGLQLIANKGYIRAIKFTDISWHNARNDTP